MQDLKDVEKLLKMLRKQGVLEFEGMGCKLKLGDLPEEATEYVDDKKADDKDIYNLTEEELQLWSAGQ